MDPIQYAYIARAQSALGMLANEALPDHNRQAKAFTDLAWITVRAGHANVGDALRASNNPLVVKAAAHSLGGDDLWEGGAAALAANYLASIAEGSILDSIKRYARVIPERMHRIMVAWDAVGDVIAEGDPKPVRHLALSSEDAPPLKACAIVVVTDELANATGREGRALFERELAAAVTRASNRSILGALVNSNTTGVAGTGDPLTDLRAGLRASRPSNGYVVAAPAADVADLATRAEAVGGMGVRGGTFRPGIEVVAVDDISGMTIIPASRIAVWDGGLQVRAAGHASIDMRDTPESPAQLTSMFHTNSLALLTERSWRLAQGTDIVVVGGES
ncbi:hypothetical protein [Luteimonas sp. A501]